MADNHNTSDSLLKTSLELWNDVLEKARSENPHRLFTRSIDFSQPNAELGPDDFSILMRTYAEMVGIDLTAYGRALVGSQEVRNELLKYHVGVALRTVFEADGYYVEIPSAFALHKVPTNFLIIMGAVLIGLATGKAAQLNTLLGGAVGGVAGLLINILAERYTASSKGSDVTWTEEFVLKFLKVRDHLSVNDLHKQMKLNKPTLRKTLDCLVEKGLVDRQKRMVGKKRTAVYSLKR